jgi:hypothetical protein
MVEMWSRADWIGDDDDDCVPRRVMRLIETLRSYPTDVR